MNREKIIIKKHISSFVLYEVIILWLYFITYLLINFYLNYNELEDHSPIRYILYMDVITWTIFILSGLLLTGIIFFRWYIDTVIVNEKFLSFRKGLLGKKQTIYFNEIEDIYGEKSFLGNYFGCGCINLKIQGKSENYKICHIPEIEKNSAIIYKRINFYKNIILKDNNLPDYELEHLLKNGEGEFVEFKQSLRWDYKLNKTNKSLEDVILKTISGFLNANGGFLFIGVDDNGTPVGLDNDYNTLKKFGKDYFEIHLRNLIISYMGKEVLSFVNIEFYTINNKEIAIVTILPTDKPVFIEKNNQWYFYVRFGNSTQPLNIKEAVYYIKSHYS